jgi:hypothetical protein
VNHLVRLRCRECGEHVGWIDPGPELVVRYHRPAEKYSTTEKRYGLDDMPVWWTCVRPSCGREIPMSRRDVLDAGGRARRGKVPDVRVPRTRSASTKRQ